MTLSSLRPEVLWGLLSYRWDESRSALVISHQVVHSRGMGTAKLELVRLSQLPIKHRVDRVERQQVAAVCFRILSTDIEFLLVRTRRNRWTFPKGGIQAGLTQAQSAAVEAYEEAGVHGRIEETSFARYTVRKTSQRELRQTQSTVHAHLCEVLRLGEPEELNRNPTWFAPAKTKRRLAEGRTSESSAELARIVDRAIARIRRFPGRTLTDNDPLMKVRFEACEFHVRGLMERDSSMAGTQFSKQPASRFDAVPRRGKILELRLVQPDRP
jgi:8-oxo-dGTP pyrophosphatase MutT (NUDIX family)